MDNIQDLKMKCFINYYCRINTIHGGVSIHSWQGLVYGRVGEQLYIEGVCERAASNIDFNNVISIILSTSNIKIFLVILIRYRIVKIRLYIVVWGDVNMIGLKGSQDKTMLNDKLELTDQIKFHNSKNHSLTM